MSRPTSLFTTVLTEGALLPSDILERIAHFDRDVPGLAPADYHLAEGERLNEAITRSWARLVPAWKGFRQALERSPSETAATTLTRERWLLVLFQELGYGRLAGKNAVVIEEKSYPISHAWNSIPIHLVGWNVDLDKRTPGIAGAARTSPHSLVQEFLNRSKALWGFLSNGKRFRILRDNSSLTRQAYVEFDLDIMMDGEAYADFALLWLVCHQSRVEAEKLEECWLERWSRTAREQGTRALEGLRQGVEEAIRALGIGFLAHPANHALRERLRNGTLIPQDYYRQTLRLVYRLLFLFVAEDRGILLDPNAPPAAKERFARFYSTARLRSLSDRIRGTSHPDLYRSLRVVMESLANDEGCPALAIPALGSFLWSPDAIPDLKDADIQNQRLLEAVRSISFIRKEKVYRAIDYKNLGTEELGSVYESLLELHPDVNTEAATFELKSASGSERKSTGSYYTPDSLVQCLLDSALEPVMEDAAKGKRGNEAAEALLKLKICDPAVGSGHFLIAAAHRLAKRVAAARTGEGEPNPGAVRTALRDVIGHCLYGVDLNPMASELCKVSLWLEALEPGKPLSFLDHHIQVGNSLLGATPELIAKGIPNEAFEAIEGDEKQVVRDLRRRNRAERTGQTTLFAAASGPEPDRNLSETVAEIERIDDATISGIHRQEAQYRSLAGSAEYRRSRLVADAWCAAFVWRKAAGNPPCVTQDTLRRIQRDSASIPVAIVEEIERLAGRYRFFHWYLAFPEVFAKGNFDCVLGNPPWEQILLNEEEWFAERHPGIAAAPTSAARRALLDSLGPEHERLVAEFSAASRAVEGEAFFVRKSGAFPLNGKGRINTYSLFQERFAQLLSAGGFAGVALQTGALTDFSQAGVTAELVRESRLGTAFDFENGAKEGGGRWFPTVHPQTHFVLLGFAGRGTKVPRVRFAASCMSEADAKRRAMDVASAFIARVSPNTGTIVLFQSEREAEIAERMLDNGVFLGSETGPSLSVCFAQPFNASSDSSLFRMVEQLGQENLGPISVIRNAEGEWWPLLEAKCGEQFNHRYGSFEGAEREVRERKNAGAPILDKSRLTDPYIVSVPRYWVRKADALEAGVLGADRWQLLYRFSAYPENERTMIAWLAPAFPSTHITPRILLPITDGRRRTAIRYALLTAALNTFAYDFLVRRRMSRQGLDFFIVKQTVVPQERRCGVVGLHPDWTGLRVLELTYTAWDLEPFARDVGYSGPPFRWDPERRFLLRCEIDAAFFHLYGLTRADAAYILDTFPVLARAEVHEHGEYRTKRVTLEIYDAMHEGIRTGHAYQTRLNPQPGPPCDAQGNFIPMAKWNRAGWPSHIHQPREAAVTRPEEIRFS